MTATDFGDSNGPTYDNKIQESPVQILEREENALQNPKKDEVQEMR